MPFVNINNTTDPNGSVSGVPNFSSTTTSNPTPAAPITPVIPEPAAADITQTQETSADTAMNPTQAAPQIPQQAPAPIQNQYAFENIELGVEPIIVKETKLPLPVSEPFVVQPKVDVAANLENKLNNISNLTNALSEPKSLEPLPVIQPIGQPPLTQLDPSIPKLHTEVPDNSSFRTFDLYELLRYAINQKSSDLHLTVGYRAMIRVDGKLHVISTPVMTPAQINQFVLEIIKTRNDIGINNIKEADLTYVLENRRFRVNIFKQMGNFSITFRVIPDKIFSTDELGLPQIVKSFSEYPNGLVLVTGPTGSGKSTTIASILNVINLTQPKHIVTLEDPVEFIFPKGIGLVDQREYGIDFNSWENALRSALRQDPDVVLIGEMRDLETVEAALQIAETGHLVFATLHTNSASDSINRIIDIFDSQKQDQIRVQLSSVLRAVLAQKLVPISRGGRRAALELLISTPSVRNAIRDKKVFQIDNIIQTSSDMGMVSLEQSLVKMVKEGVVSKEVAKSLSLNQNQMDILLQ